MPPFKETPIWESMYLSFANQLFNTNRSFAKDSSDLCRFGEGLRTSSTRTPIRGDVDVTEKCFVVEGGGDPCTRMNVGKHQSWADVQLMKLLFVARDDPCCISCLMLFGFVEFCSSIISIFLNDFTHLCVFFCAEFSPWFLDLFW